MSFIQCLPHACKELLTKKTQLYLIDSSLLNDSSLAKVRNLHVSTKDFLRSQLGVKAIMLRLKQGKREKRERGIVLININVFFGAQEHLVRRKP